MITNIYIYIYIDTYIYIYIYISLYIDIGVSRNGGMGLSENVWFMMDTPRNMWMSWG